MTDAAATPTPSAEAQQQPPPAAAAPMDAEPTTESFAAQKARIAELEASLARERATSSIFVDKEREKVQAFEAPAKWFFGEFLPEGEAQEVKSDLAPLSVWANEMAQKKDVLAQVSLARACHVASAKFKRMRDEASAGSEAKESLGKTMKENEELKADISNKAQRIVELESLATERQQQAERLQAELAKHGLIAEKFNFSKLAAREEGAAHDAEGDVKMEGASAATSNAAGKAPVADGPLAGTVSNASRGAAGHSGNPFEGDSLAMMIAARGSGGLKMAASGTQHAFLGAQDSSGDLAALLKAR
jgi:hypothetical protein